MRQTLAMLAALTVSAAMAIPLPEDFDYRTFDATTGFDVHSSADAYSGYSGGTWLPNWTSGGAPHSGTNYYSNGKLMYAPKMSSGNPVFPGDLLALDSIIKTPQGSKKFVFNELIGLGGGILGIGSTGQGVITTGDFTIHSSESKPFAIQRNAACSKSYTYTFEVGGKFRSTPESWLVFNGDKTYATTNAQWLFTFKFPSTTDTSEFYGTVRMPDACIELDTPVFGGTFEMTNEWFGVTVDPLGRPVENTPARLYAKVCNTSAKGVILHAGTQFDLATAAYDWSVGDLVDNGGELLFKVSQTANQGGTLTITNSISIADKLRIVNTAAAWTTVGESAPAEMPLIEFGTEVDLTGVDVGCFELVQALNADTTTGTFPVPKLVLRENRDGTRTLVLTRNKIVKNIKIEGDVSKNFVYGSGSNWSDGLPEHGDVDYFLNWNVKQPQYYFEQDCVFPSENLLANNGEIFPHARLFVTNLVFGSKIGFHVNKAGDFGVDGRLGIFGTDSNVNCAGAAYTFELASDVYGPGRLDFKGSGSVTVSGDNQAFSGRLGLCLSTTTLRLGSASSLGGAMPAFAYDGVTLGYGTAGACAKVVPLASLTVDEQTRGIFITNCVEVAVDEGVAFTVKSPLTYRGEIYKSGAGTLVLASKARFVDGDEATEPIEGLNKLTVAGGSVKVADAEALNGLAVTVAAGATLRLDAAADGDLGTYGLKLTRSLSSIAPAEADGRIRIVLDVAEPASDFTRNIATFATREAADAFAAKAVARLSVPGYRVTLSVVQNGTFYTVKGEAGRSGMVVIFK